MSDASQSEYGGRAKGRSRGRARTQEELDAMRRPGGAGIAAPAPAPQATGRGRGISQESAPQMIVTGGTGRGRGVSQEQPPGAASMQPSTPGAAYMQPSTPGAASMQPSTPGEASAPQTTTTGGTGRGRGVSQERPGPASVQPAAQSILQPGGRAHRGGTSSLVPRPGMSGVTGALAAATISPHSSSGGQVGSNEAGAAGNENGSVSVGRGNSRGRRERAPPPIIRTKPAEMDSKKGSGGREIQVLSNYFAMKGKTNWVLTQYRVDFKPDEDESFIRKMLIRDVHEQLPKYVFDGSVMWTTQRLNNDKSPIVLETTRKRDGMRIEITIREVGEVHPSDAHYLQFFGSVVKQCLAKLGLQLLNRSYFDPKAEVTFKDFKLKLWPGYATTTHQHENDILLGCEITNKILRTDTVLDQLRECYKKDKNNFETVAKRTLLGAIVLTRYNNKTYRIDDIEFKKSPNDTFDMKGTTTDLKKYYADKYNCKITDPQQPLLVCMPKEREARSGVSGPIWLIPELCNMTGLSDAQRADFKLMKAMADYTRQTPEKRVESLRKFSKRINETPEITKLLTDWNMQFEKELIKFNARVLAPEKIFGGVGAKPFDYREENADWGGAFKKWKFVSVATCTKWAVIYPERLEQDSKKFISSLVSAGPAMGLAFLQPLECKITGTAPAAYIQKLDVVIDQGPDIVMIIIPNDKGEHYHAIKKKCCIDKPIPSQVMTGPVIGKAKQMMSVASKVAIQMQCKLGGEPWSVKWPAMQGTMIVGYDAYKDSSMKGTSCGAVVSSLNDRFTKYSSTCIFHTSNLEITKGMGPAITKALRRFREANGCLPTRVIMFRDGVGDGDLAYVKDTEIGAIKKCFKDNNIEDKVSLAYIIVSKRINTRFFATSGNGNGKVSNPPSGTVVDDVVTLPERYDFFLVSQSVKQGTVNPTSYNIIEDSSGLKPAIMQKLAYKLTHLYYNWPGTVRVPAPCQYAHKLAKLAGESLHKEPSEKLENLLFYL